MAAQELRKLILQDNIIHRNKSQKVPLANYNPQVDWESSCPIVKIFIDEILPENDSSLFKVIFRNNIFLGNQKRKYPFKPQSYYFISSVIKYLHDKQKILDFLSMMGIGVGDDPINNLEKNQIDEFNRVFFKDDGNVLKERLINGKKYCPYNLYDPMDPSISWDNKFGSKTSLRFLKIGKSTDDHVFLESLEFLYNTFKTDARKKIFITLDQALHAKYKTLETRGKMPHKFSDFFIVVLDPFHHQWCLLKCLFSAYEDAGLKDLVAILGVDEKKWPNMLGESKNVHKAQETLVVIATSFGVFFLNYYLNHITAEQRTEYETKALSEKVKWISHQLPSFLDKVALTDKTLAIFIELYKFSLLVIQCWESQRVANYDMYIHSIKETLPYIFCFNRYNYQQSALEFLADISLLGDFYKDLLQSGIMFESLANQPGKQVSCGYVLEIFNKIIKQISPNIDSTGNAWLRNLPRLAFIRQILLNAANAKLFSESEKDPITAKVADLEQISKLRWVLEHRNIIVLI